MSENLVASTKEFCDQSFSELEVRDQLFRETIFENCTFLRLRFVDSAFVRCRVIDCTFEECDLSNLSLENSEIRSPVFKDCKLVGVNWTAAASVMHPEWTGCVLNYGNFGGLDLRKAKMKSCHAREADFADTNFTDTDLRATDFTGARFASTNLTKADLRQATNYSIRPDSNKLKGAKFSLPEATLLLYGMDIVLEE